MRRGRLGWVAVCGLAAGAADGGRQRDGFGAHRHAILRVAANLNAPRGHQRVNPLAGVQLAWQVRTLDLDDPVSCLVRFRSNREFGLLVFLALLAGKVGP